MHEDRFTLRRLLRSPASFLSAVNVAGAALGMVQGLLAARVLGASAYGVIAVVAGISAVVLNFLDVRMVDLAGRLYYRSDLAADVDRQAYRASVLQLAVAGNGIISLVLCLLGFAANVVAVQWFTATPVPLAWIALQVGTLALLNWTGTFVYLQRFSGRFYLMGVWKLVAQLVSMSIYLGILLSMRSLDGYFIGQFAAASTAGLVAIALTLHIWRGERLPIGRRTVGLAWADFRGSVSFLALTNALGYGKLLHRAADTLVVGYFCNDRDTGLYKFARTLTDSLYLLYEALAQVYTPRFLQLLAERAEAVYRRLALRVVVVTAAFTAVVLLGELLVLPWLMRVVLVDRFAGAESAVLVLTIPFFFVTGVHLWLWPLFVHSGRLGGVTAAHLAAGVAQYVVMLALFAIVGPSPVAAAIGYVSYYLVSQSASLAMVARTRPGVLPWTVSPASA